MVGLEHSPLNPCKCLECVQLATIDYVVSSCKGVSKGETSVLVTYPQLSPPLRDCVIAAAPESQNTHDTNKLEWSKSLSDIRGMISETNKTR